MIREATPDDYPGMFEVSRTSFPDFVTTLGGFVHRQTSMPPEARPGMWVAESEGRIAGWARAYIRFEESGGSASVGVSVLPERRRRGLGSALLERALAHVAEAPRAFAFATEGGSAFAERHGFELTQTLRVSAVDPRAVDTSELDRAGVDVRALAELGPEAVFAVDSVAALDVPADEPPDAVELEQWIGSYWESPDFDWSASYGALVDGLLAAVSYAAVDLPGRRAANAFTGTLPEYRGRSLARLVKLAVLRRLAELGIERVFTDNDERNAPMLAVNERLGYRPHTAHAIYVRSGSGNGLRASAGST